MRAGTVRALAFARQWRLWKAVREPQDYWDVRDSMGVMEYVRYKYRYTNLYLYIYIYVCSLVYTLICTMGIDGIMGYSNNMIGFIRGWSWFHHGCMVVGISFVITICVMSWIIWIYIAVISVMIWSDRSNHVDGKIMGIPCPQTQALPNRA